MRLAAAGIPTRSSILNGAIESFLLRDFVVLQDHLHDLHADREHGIQRRHRLLEDHADFVSANLSNVFPGQLEQILSLVDDRAADDFSREDPESAAGC